MSSIITREQSQLSSYSNAHYSYTREQRNELYSEQKSKQDCAMKGNLKRENKAEEKHLILFQQIQLDLIRFRLKDEHMMVLLNMIFGSI